MFRIALIGIIFIAFELSSDMVILRIHYGEHTRLAQ